MKKLLLLLLSCILIQSASSQSLNLVGHLGYNVTCAGVWHHVDSLNNEYALVGASDRVSIVDVTVPSNPVEVYSVPCLSGQTSLWRELKTYNNYAYAVSEGGGGVIIIDLKNLPGPVTYTHWYGDSIITNQLQSAHTIAATDGYLYIFGSNIGVGGCIIADISNPAQPHFIGQYNEEYIHDGYIRNDTLWAGEIYVGQFSIIDVSNKSLPVLLNNQATPGAFCHNVWLSDNSNYAFTTDEVTGAPLGSFDVSNINNIQLKTVYFTDSIPNEEVHNVRVLNDYLINPSYGSQLTLVDAARPDNLIEIARAPTDFGSGQPFLCWDASPYLPSGNIIATDISGGLFVFTPDYKRACYLEGITTDSITGSTLNNVLVEILNTTKSTSSDLSGNYKSGIATSGTYDIQFSKPGYISKIYSGISLNNGVLTTLNAELASFSASGNVTSFQTTTGIPNVNISATNGSNTITATTDTNGNFTFNNIASGTYTITAAAWGYITSCITTVIDGTPLNFILQSGYSDDFTTDNNWQVSSTCSTGAWVRDVPVGTTYGAVIANPATDFSSDCGNICFVTGNGGGTSNTDDLDGGSTTLTSPVFDLTSYTNAYVSYSYWYFINNNAPVNNIDTMFFYLNNGTTTVLIDSAYLNFNASSTWLYKTFRIADYITPTNNMTFIVYFEDKASSGNICEGGFDNFSVVEIITSVDELETSKIQVNPNPSSAIFNISIPADLITSSTTIQITDATGRAIYTSGVESHVTTINLENVPSGLYIASVIGSKKPVKAVKLIKN